MKKLIISSKNKQSGESNNKFTVLLSDPITGFDNIRLSKIAIPHTWYTIMTDINDKIYFKVSTTTYTSTIPQGVYSDSELATAIQTQMNSDYTTDNNFSVSVGTSSYPYTYKYTISHSSTNFQLMFATNTTNSISNTIGFNNTDSSAAQTFTSDNVYNLNYCNTLYINTNLCDGNTLTKDGFSDIINEFFITGNFGDNMIYYDLGQSDDYVLSKNKRVQKIIVEITFNNGRLVPLNGGNVYLNFKLF